MYIAPGQGQTNPWGQKFYVNRNSLSLCPFVASLRKKISLSLIFYRFLFSHVYSPRQGQTTHWGQKFYDNKKAFSFCPYVASFKMISSKSDFIHTFNDFIHVAPGQGQKTPGEQTFDVNRKLLSLPPFVASFKQISLKFYTHFFYIFPHVCSLGAGSDNPVDKILISIEKPCHFAHLLQVSKKHLWSLILYTLFHIFLHVYSPGAGADNPLGSEFLCKHIPYVTLVICCKFLPLNDFITVFPI